MRIAILGGTGDLGMGLAVRLSPHHDILVGSRDEARARAAAERVKAASGSPASGLSNVEAARNCEVAILAVPDLPTDDMLLQLAPSLQGKLVISPIVPMSLRDGVFAHAMESGSAAERVASALKTRVSAAFHTVPAEKLLKPGLVLDMDVLVAADTAETFQETAKIVGSIPGLRPLHAGPLRISRMLESLTPTLLNIGRFSKIRSPSIKVV